ncbi:sulfatase-like hydrolase/transferase [Paenibacillus silvisoli]|uniref:sulfatase-like hydrolase/transferase n=1 Tax=Paenibacillus silvisoli TaxID=3110539 RepID=UPI0028054A77|nr:sulfatase-like hydrolase/transferase [Paenibacillus silvisoli]
MKDKPHLILFNPDQWRSDAMGHLGNAAAVTPHLDRMVETDGVSFRNAFCQNTVCTPSRCSFMSGWYPHVRGHRTMHHMMQPDEPVLLKTLKDAGYYVWWGGKNDLIPAGNGYDAYCHVKYKPDKPPRPESNLHAYDTWRGSPESDNYFSFYAGKLEKGDQEDQYHDGDWANVLGAIDMIRNAPKGKPLCIYLPLLYPHPPYGVEEPYFSMIDRTKLPPRIPSPERWDDKPSILKGIYDKQRLQSWTEDRWDELRATYHAMCARVDHQFGMLMDALREADMYDDTAVFFFSDHGDFTGDYGLVEKTQNTFEDCLSRVPFIVKPPKSVPVKPRVTDALIELIDLSATVESLAGLTTNHTHFGKSLLPIIAGDTEAHRDAVFCEGGRLHGEAHCMEREYASETGSLGLYWPRIQWQLQEGPEHTKATMCRTMNYKYVRRLYEQDELYDLVEDPSETTNLIHDPRLASVLAEMKERLLTFYQETCDVVPQKSDKRS